MVTHFRYKCGAVSVAGRAKVCVAVCVAALIVENVQSRTFLSYGVATVSRID